MEQKKLYIVDWEHSSGTIELDEYKVPLPFMPPFSEMENFGLPIEEQKFSRTVIPRTLLRRKQCTPEEEFFIRSEYHKIHNGIWMLIKGQPTYLSGAFYFFLNYWTTQKGIKPNFLYVQCQIFLFWEMCIRNPDCYGMFLIKPRRIGGTEMTIEMLWLDAMRYRNMVCGMQSKNEDSVYKNYKRIIKSHKSMIWFMKPINQGSTENKEGLFFKYPVEQNSARRNKEIAEKGEDIETIYEDQEIGSEITYQPSVATAYDGERLDRYILNEFGKCFSEGTKILMYDGTIKKVQDVLIGDLLMGDDKTPRTVLEILTGNGELYKITPADEDFMEWSCGVNHLLSLKYKTKTIDKVINISIDELLSQSNYKRKNYYLYKTDGSTSRFKLKYNTDGYYYGLTIDGNRLHLLADFQVVHNCEKMDVEDCWDKVKPCLHLDNGMVITGKAIFESTVEEINDNQIESINNFYYGSNINKLDDNGRTETGLFRLFINALDAAKADEYGFPKKEETRLFLERQFDVLKRSGKTKELARLKRKTPLFVEDALTPSGSSSAFHKEKLQETLDQINAYGEGQTERGNFQWENGIPDTAVEFIPDPEGRWEVAKLTGFDINNVLFIHGERYPGNPSQFRAGIDPYSHKETQDNRKSLGGSVGFELYDENKDGDKFQTEAGVKIALDGGLKFLTNQPIFTYMYRHENPDLFFEDMVLQSHYYGMPVLPENNKPDLVNHFNRRGYGRFVINRPKETLPKDSKVQTQGAPASDLTIEQYFNKISSYIYNYHNAIKFKSLVLQLLSMNRSNITKHDLGVAFGWCLIAVSAEFIDLSDVIQQQEKSQQWFDYAENN